MKINKITNAQEFFKVVDDCKGRVELLTGEGDRLNLKSKLCQFMSMTQIFSRADELHLEIVASEEEDLQKMGISTASLQTNAKEGKGRRKK